MPANPLDPGHTPWDVVIIGAGPAGSATAITLARFGRRVLLVEERVGASFKLGESLPPSCVPMVRHFLPDMDSPESTPPGSFKTAGNVSQWVTQQPDITDFFFTLNGSGLCVERLAFDEALRSEAVAAGATLLKGVRFDSCIHSEGAGFDWQLTLSSSTQTDLYCARYLVDCSGRRAVVARALGIPILDNDDHLFAYAQWYESDDDDDDRYTRIEAAPQGWWYSNRLPGMTDTQTTRRLVVFHSDKDLPAAKQAARPQGFEQLLTASTHIAPLLKARGYQPCGTIRGAPANSQRLQHFCGVSWMAVGDAAQAYDPLSSQGIDKALRTGSHAGHMIHYALTDCAPGSGGLDISNEYVRQYVDQQNQLWQTYLSQRDFYYRMQPRWPDLPFWQRRHSRQHASIAD